MALFRRRWEKVVLGSGILLTVYAITRLYNLTLLPIFTDEAIYIRWSQIGARDANWRFISLVDGKQPLFTWAMMVLLRLLPSLDPLFVGRLTSVLAGAASLVGIWCLSWQLFESRRIAWIASVLYLLSPFTLMYDRMALYDGMVATFSIWNLYLAILLVRTLRLDVALILGMTLGAGMLNKTSGFLSLYMLPATLLLFVWGDRGTLRLGQIPAGIWFRLGQGGRWGKLRRLGRWIVLVGVAAILSQVFYSVLRLSPFFHMISQKDVVFVYSFAEWWQHKFLFLQGNLRGLFDWTWRYLTLPIFAAAMAPFFSLWSKPREKLFLYISWFAPFFALATFGRVLYPRFILFMTMPLLLLAAVSIARIWGRFLRLRQAPAGTWLRSGQVGKLGRWGAMMAVGLLFLGVSLRTDFLILTNPVKAPLPRSDRGQYLADWPAGWGVREVVIFLKEEMKKGQVTVWTEGTFGLFPYALEIYLVDQPNITIRGIWPLPQDPPKELIEAASREPTYFVLNQTQVAPSGWPLTLIAEYQKGDRKDRKLRFYKVVAALAQAAKTGR